MDSNDKNISPVDPLPPVQVSSVHVICAGNVNDRLNVSLGSCACLVDWLA
jgi:hypothetical protein